MSFTAVANKIIEDSIVSSLYIDDKVVEPFETITDGNSVFFEVSKGLYSSFKEKNKSLDFYKFHLSRDWRNDADYIFKNRDLLVLDWQLDDSQGLRQKNTLEILHRAITTDSLHFVSIYTTTDRTLFKDIFFTIKAYFDKEYNSNTHEKCAQVLTAVDAEGIDTKFIHKLSGRFKDISLELDKKELLKELKEIFQNELQDKYRIFANGLKEINSDLIRACEIFGYYINDELYNESEDKHFEIRTSFIEDGFLVVNHTIVQLTNKSNPIPSEHFSFFSGALLKVCGNLLTLTSLEIRTLLRESSGFVGKDADSINEAALFHHQLRKESFFDFIIDIWKGHALSFVNYKSDQLETLNKSFWGEYGSENNIDAAIALLQSDQNTFFKELAKLNVFYNLLHINKPTDDIIKFGDVFTSLNEAGISDGKYWLNISAHCDCLAPEENLKNNFYFIGGQKHELEKALAAGDGGFYSYLNLNGSATSVAWNNRPVVLNVVKSKMNNYTVEVTDGIGKKFKLSYVCTLKENYTQRMANNGFSFAMRVGIDFAGINK